MKDAGQGDVATTRALGHEKVEQPGERPRAVRFIRFRSPKESAATFPPPIYLRPLVGPGLRIT